jgi:hypothetical protein
VWDVHRLGVTDRSFFVSVSVHRAFEAFWEVEKGPQSEKSWLSLLAFDAQQHTAQAQKRRDADDVDLLKYCVHRTKSDHDRISHDCNQQFPVLAMRPRDSAARLN